MRFSSATRKGTSIRYNFDSVFVFVSLVFEEFRVGLWKAFLISISFFSFSSPWPDIFQYMLAERAFWKQVLFLTRRN